MVVVVLLVVLEVDLVGGKVEVVVLVDVVVDVVVGEVDSLAANVVEPGVVKYCVTCFLSNIGLCGSTGNSICWALRVKPLVPVCNLYSNGFGSGTLLYILGYLSVVLELAPFKTSVSSADSSSSLFGSCDSFSVGFGLKLCGDKSDII